MKILNKIFLFLAALSCICAFGIFIYPTMYKYDKLDQKYPVKINRITGETEILKSKGWEHADDYKSAAQQMEAYRNDIAQKIDDQNDTIKAAIISNIKDDIVNQVTADVKDYLTTVKKEVSEYKNTKTSPNGYFTTGDTFATVKKVMGTADSITDVGIFTTWWYGRSSIHFENGKVTGWTDFENNLSVK
jgi:hypothetical protein